ncbi:MAG: TonB-dependent receptor [Planctomycetota bacterium]
MIRSLSILLAVLAVLCAAPIAAAQNNGSIRGTVTDFDYETPVAGARVQVVGLGRSVETNDQGGYLIVDLPAGRYDVSVSKEGYTRLLKSGIIVNPGDLKDLDVALVAEVFEMEEFFVQDALALGGGSEAALLQLRFESPSLLDSIGSDLISRAGASDAASALRLVSGASVANGKSAVIRGLPDRYVSSQLNGVRLPSADEDKRAVELDQFPSAVIESIQVAKTFTPDQQGDASGGAVNVRLKGLPSEPFFVKFKAQTGVNTHVGHRGDFLADPSGGVNFLGKDRRRQQTDLIGMNWEGAVGVEEQDAPIDSKWSLATGGSLDLGEGFRVGGFASLFYERDSSFYDNGVDDSYWVVNPGDPLTPRYSQGAPSIESFRTSLFDVTRAQESVQWGGLGTFGVEWEDQKVTLTYLYSRTTESTATLSTDTRGKSYFFPGFDPNDPNSPGSDIVDAAPYIRLETLNYTERTTSTFQINGQHKLPVEGFGVDGLLEFLRPELDWTVAFSNADLYQPDKRQFGSYWIPDQVFAGGAFVIPAAHYAFKPDANFNLGNLQRIWKEIEEESDQYAINLKLPFERWDGEKGYLKAGYFSDTVHRTFDQDSYSNFNDNSNYEAPYEASWSAVFPTQDHPITESLYDVDYDGTQEIRAWYVMLDAPIVSGIKVTGGVRFETTRIGIVNDAESLATWYPPGSISETQLNPGEADVSIEQDDILPSIGLEWKPFGDLTLRAAYNETIARQTFKELSPILQQEFLGGPIFIGNPDLELSAIKNYDLRADWTPFEGGLISASWFRKDLEKPIEYVKRVASFSYTTPVNYPKGRLTGVEVEFRQDLGVWLDELKGFSIGANATFISSRVDLPQDEIDDFAAPNLQVPITSRDMTNAPEHLYNIFITYDNEEWGTQVSLFYTVQGDTLVAGAGESGGNFLPSEYAKEFETLNFSLSQRIGEYFRLQFQAKNLTNPSIDRVLRSEFTGPDVTSNSYTKGIDFSLSLSAEIKF